jgi:sensor domain CHASE-containing protein
MDKIKELTQLTETLRKKVVTLNTLIAIRHRYIVANAIAMSLETRLNEELGAVEQLVSDLNTLNTYIDSNDIPEKHKAVARSVDKVIRLKLEALADKNATNEENEVI